MAHPLEHPYLAVTAAGLQRMLRVLQPTSRRTGAHGLPGLQRRWVNAWRSAHARTRAWRLEATELQTSNLSPCDSAPNAVC